MSLKFRRFAMSFTLGMMLQLPVCITCIDSTVASSVQLPSGPNWDDSRLLSLRQAFEDQLLKSEKQEITHGGKKYAPGQKGYMRAYIANHFVGQKVEEEIVTQDDADAVADMIEARLNWLAPEVSDELRQFHSTTTKKEHIHKNPVEGREYEDLPGGAVSRYEVTRLYNRLVETTEE